MFEKIGRLAEAAAANVSVSRRGFFGQLGRGALVVAGTLGGLLSTGAPVRAGTQTPCCGWGHCSAPAQGCVFVGTLTCYYPTNARCVWNCNGTSMRSRCHR
jgi:hypothetical protein